MQEPLLNEENHTPNLFSLPVPPNKRRNYVDCLREWLNIDYASLNQSRTIAIGCNTTVWSGAGYPSNAVNNRRYSLLTFLPLSLFNQFKVFFNVFYLFLTFSQLIPPLKVGFFLTYFLPLALVVLLSLIKDAVDDIKRYRRDREINTEKFEKLLANGSTVFIAASSIQVGDLLILRSGHRIPADCVVLRTSDKAGTCFVRTDYLDGETDWKLRYALNMTQSLSDVELGALRANIHCEPLQEDIYKFAGTFEVSGSESEAISLENTLWATCVVASGTLVAAVLYTGVDTRCTINSNKPSSKQGLIESELNLIGIFCFLFLLGFSFFLVATQRFEGNWLVMFFRFIILLSALLPISMRVHVDIGRIWYSFDIYRDLKIQGTVARNTNIPEELGRLQYFFTDKTGTLTKNKMEFRTMQVGAGTIISYYEVDRFRKLTKIFFASKQDLGVTTLSEGSKNKNAAFQRNTLREASAVGEALLGLVLCHNVNPVMENNSLQYQAASSDEVAFVRFCNSIGISLVYRDVNSMRFTISDGRILTYKIIKTFPFTSERKCMGIILGELRESGEIRYKYIMKGADTKIASVIRSSDWLNESCQEFSQSGLRTLVFAQRSLTKELLNAFLQSYHAAITDLSETRSSLLETAMSMIEKEMKLVAVTGVEDELQDDVTTSIETLGMGGIKVWILTGDKVETATTIGRSTRLIPRHGVVEHVKFCTKSEAEQGLNALLCRYYLNSGAGYISTPWTLVLDGDSLSVCLLRPLVKTFVELSRTAHSVIVARCSPTQKAEVVSAMRKYTDKNVRMAAVGDGGNDVAMILAADVGIGVEGVEGNQASMAADFSITKFSHCVRLIMWHGRNSYQRTCRMSQFILHRGMVYAIIQALFSLMFSSTSMPVFNSYLLVGYSTLFTVTPVFALVLDEDIKEEDVREFPQHYKELIKARSMNTRSFLQWTWISLFQGGMLMLISFLLGEDFFQILTVAYTSLILTELLIAAFAANICILWASRSLHFWFLIFAQFFSFFAYFIAVLVLPDTFDVEFFFSLSCWWRVTVVSISIIGPCFIIWFLSTKVMFIRKVVYSFV